ncbi:S41 family peptidase [Amycolatopsis jejuensis]|uniref:S41 family peptidase n=1 Tax=Amycolatopsis jejuensis TaxID=330084 RepID=UPI00248018E9|nr:S41 family peptidase [Amycolatopsis jejuensis]
MWRREWPHCKRSRLKRRAAGSSTCVTTPAATCGRCSPCWRRCWVTASSGHSPDPGSPRRRGRCSTAEHSSTVQPPRRRPIRYGSPGHVRRSPWLTSRHTASSGEATLVAFRGMPRVETFGASTAGVATGNEVFSLSDGAKLLVTSVVDVDRTGRVYGNVAIEPDHLVSPADAEAVAVQWVRANGCG